MPFIAQDNHWQKTPSMGMILQAKTRWLKRDLSCLNWSFSGPFDQTKQGEEPSQFIAGQAKQNIYPVNFNTQNRRWTLLFVSTQWNVKLPTDILKARKELLTLATVSWSYKTRSHPGNAKGTVYHMICKPPTQERYWKAQNNSKKSHSPWGGTYWKNCFFENGSLVVKVVGVNGKQAEGRLDFRLRQQCRMTSRMDQV